MGRTLQDTPESIDIFTSFPPTFIVATILFEWLSTALISSSEQDTERISSSLSSNWTDSLNAFVEVFLSYVASFCGNISRQNDKQSTFSQKLDTLISPSLVFDHKIGALRRIFIRIFIRALRRIFDKLRLRRWVWNRIWVDMASSWVDVASALRHISIHFLSVSSGTCSSFFLKPLSRTPQTILSLIISS